jgi:hypothetical protein
MLVVLGLAASNCPGDELPKVFLNHFAVVVDPASFNALRSSPDVAALAKVDEIHVVAGSRNWSGFYIFGRQTYIEVFAAGAVNEMRLGDSQFNLSVEESGGVSKIAAHLRRKFGTRVYVSDTPRTTASGPIPWLKGTGISSDGPEAMSTGFLETDAGYLAAIHPGAKVEHPLSREQYESWRFLADRPFDDVVGLTAALNPADAAQLATELELVGWSVQPGGTGFVAVGPDIRLTVVRAGAREGIEQADLRLRHPVARQTVTLGAVRLLLDGDSGRFVFF